MIFQRAFITTVLALALGACGGSGGGDGAAPDPGGPIGGIGRTGVAMGPISAFGSVVVNGVRFDTSNAAFTIDDAVGSEDQLKVGQLVIVQGSIDENGTTGTAEQVIFDDNVEGPIASIDLAAGIVTVLGQTVRITADTSFDDDIVPASLDGLSVGDVIEVSGFVDANGTISATRIELVPPGEDFEVHGFVSNLDTAALTFSLSDLTVDYSAATLEDFPGGQISEGDFVEAEGSVLSAGGDLQATSVEFEDGIDLTDVDEVKIEGIITRFVSATDFDVAGLPVTTTGATTYEEGDASNLGLNVLVEVEGQVDANGVLVADEIEFNNESAIRVTAVVDSVDAQAGSVVMLGITINTDERTRFEDRSDAEQRILTLNDIAAGQYVEVRGVESPAGNDTVRATLLEREEPEAESELQGFVSAISDPSFTILGVTVETGAGTVFRAEDESVLTAAEFFARLSAGDLVSVDGIESSATVIMAEEVEFEDL